MIFIPAGIAAMGLLVTIFCQTRFVSHSAILSVLALAILVPSNSPTRDVLAFAAGGALLILVSAAFRTSTLITKSVPNVWLLLFLMYSSTVMAIGIGGTYGWFAVILNCVYLLLALFASNSSIKGTNVLYLAAPLFVFIEFMLTCTEEFFSFKALWPQTSGTDFITHRLNTIAPWLPGRAMGSTSHPIPLGILVGILCVLCIWISVKRWSSFWIFSIAAGLVLIFSGTRSAFLAMFVALAYWFVVSAGVKRIPLYVIGGLLAIVVLLAADPVALFGLNNFVSSESYQHRADVLAFLPELGSRSPVEFLFGSGYGSIGTLLQSSSFSDGSGILVFDEEYIRTFVATGLLGLGLLVAAVVEGFKRGNIPSRMILIFLCVSFFSFDALSWNMTTVLFVVACSGPAFSSFQRSSISALPADFQTVGLGSFSSRVVGGPTSSGQRLSGSGKQLRR